MLEMRGGAHKGLGRSSFECTKTVPLQVWWHVSPLEAEVGGPVCEFKASLELLLNFRLARAAEIGSLTQILPAPNNLVLAFFFPFPQLSCVAQAALTLPAVAS